MLIQVDQSIELLKNGNVVALPTETVYGLAASLQDISAIEKIFTLKGRPKANPLIVHVHDGEILKKYIQYLPEGFEKLGKAFWPGPMTLVLAVNQDAIPSVVRAGLPTAGFRIPDHPLTRAVLKETGPLVMPSANLSGKPSATNPIHVEEDFGVDFPVLDGGSCEKGLESTILCEQNGFWVILRLGSLSPEDFSGVLGYVPEVVKANFSKPLCPGQLFRHYAPKAKLILNTSYLIQSHTFILGFKERKYPTNNRIIYLGSLFNPQDVAEHLYENLRRLDFEGAKEAWVDMDFPFDGLWLTIRERFLKGAAN